MLSIDGKKLAECLDKLGDEDMCGFEPPPTLQDRKNPRIIAEMKNIEDVKETTNKDVSGRYIQEVESIPKVDKTEKCNFIVHCTFE
jgi:hypothetical protein